MILRRNPVGSSSSTIKPRNMSAVLLMLLRYGRISRVDLADLTGLSTTTITNLVTELIEAGIVAQEDQDQPLGRQRSVGRPRRQLHLVPDARYALGIHFGVGSIRVALTDLLAQPIAVDALEHPLDLPVAEVLAQTGALAQGLIRRNPQLDRSHILGLGVGASGLVDPLTGVNILAPNLNWHDVPLQDYFASKLHLPVTVDNNVRAMALGEALFGVGKDVYSLAFVYARVGVGAGIVVGGRLYYGGGAGAGEIGHMTILPEGGPRCRCGNSGCLETLISEPVILREAQAIVERNPGGLLARHWREGSGPLIERVFAAARAGDGASCDLLNRRAHYMGIALANLVNILNPELIVLGGILAQGQDLLLPVIRETMVQRAFARLGEKVALVPPSFNHQNAGVIGAAALALNRFFYQHYEGAA
ncbi:MAG: ROK family transcriptional regulator [Anaerolineae bacterium]|nr:ROK family transcriptional regulator [Anaerolineae bacterium]